MEVPNHEQNVAHIMHKVKSELEETRKSVRQGTAQADSGQIIPADEVFSELRQRNAAAAKQSG